MRGQLATGPPRVVLACDFHLKYSIGLAGGLRRHGVDAALVTRDHALEFGGDREALARALHDALEPGAVHLLPGRVRDISAVPEVVRISRRAARPEPRVVHLQERAVNDMRLLAAARVWPGRYALTVHDPVQHPGDAPRARVGALADRALLRGAGLVFVHAEALHEELLETAAVTAPVVVVPHGVHPPDVRPRPEIPTLLCFGRLSRYKGIDVLLDAMPRVWDVVPTARLVIVGEGDLHGSGVAGHRALDDPRVHLRREHVAESEVAELFAQASIVVLPYRQASQSGVGSQAKSFGRPLVVTRLGGLPELVSDGSGLIVEPEDPRELASACVALLSDDGKATQMGEQGARSIDRRSSWRRVAELTLRAYDHARLTD